MKFHGVWVPPPYPRAFSDHGRNAQQEPFKPSIFCLQNSSGKINFLAEQFFFLFFFCNSFLRTRPVASKSFSLCLYNKIIALLLFKLKLHNYFLVGDETFFFSWKHLQRLFERNFQLRQKSKGEKWKSSGLNSFAL